MKRPWMPLYVGDYLANTCHLNTEQHGAYLLLILHYWANGGLPDNDEQLATIARMTAKQWAKNKATIKGFFVDGWKHKRIEEELAITQEMTEKRAAAGREGGLASARKRQQTSSKNEANVNHSHSHSPSQSDSKIVNINGHPAKEVKYPRHGQTAHAEGIRRVYWKRGTPEFDAYAQDFQESKQEPPNSTADGRWFKYMGERATE